MDIFFLFYNYTKTFFSKGKEVLLSHLYSLCNFLLHLEQQKSFHLQVYCGSSLHLEDSVISYSLQYLVIILGILSSIPLQNKLFDATCSLCILFFYTEFLLYLTDQIVQKYTPHSDIFTSDLSYSHCTNANYLMIGIEKCSKTFFLGWDVHSKDQGIVYVYVFCGMHRTLFYARWDKINRIRWANLN